MVSLEQLQDNWPVIGGFVAGVVAWGRTVTKVQHLEGGQLRADTRVTKIESDIAAIRDTCARTETASNATHEMMKTLLQDRLDK